MNVATPEFQSLQVPPQNLTAERSVLGSLLLDTRCFDELADLIRPEHFYADVHATLFRAICRMIEQNRPVDAVTLADALEEAGELADCGGVPAILELLETVPHAGHAVYYAKIVRDRWSQRELQSICQTSLRTIFDESADSEDVLETHEQALFVLTDQQQSRSQEQSLGDVLVLALDAINDRMMNPQSVHGLSMGFTDLDHTTGGLRAGQLMILAARPSMGKTAFVCNVGDWLSSSQKKALFFSLEQSKLELAERFLCIRGGLDGHAVRRGALDHEQRTKLLDAAAELNQSQLWIDDTPQRTMSEIRSIARRTKRRHGLDVIIIDYLQLIEPEDKRANREVQIATIARHLKGLAKSLEIPVIALSQLNRSVELREDKRPRLADLRESGAIEQDADIVTFLHRPEYYDPLDSPGITEVIIAKHRSGPTGTVKLAWQKESMTFVDIAQHASNQF